MFGLHFYFLTAGIQLADRRVKGGWEKNLEGFL